jgi:hypothetical protein
LVAGQAQEKRIIRQRTTQEIDLADRAQPVGAMAGDTGGTQNVEASAQGLKFVVGNSTVNDGVA